MAICMKNIQKMFITPQFLKTYVKLRDMGGFIYL